MKTMQATKSHILDAKVLLIKHLEELSARTADPQLKGKIQQSIVKIESETTLVPLVGIFSSGKSSLINSIIERPIFTTSITPETALPAHIKYGEKVKLTARSNKTNLSYDTNFDEIEKNLWAHKYQNFLKNNKKAIKPRESNINDAIDDMYLDVQIPAKNLISLKNITIVDMPGFDSSNQEHDQVAHSYLFSSAAYIVCISADEGTIRQSLLKLIEKIDNTNLLCGIIITKADKHEPEKIKEIINQVKKEYRNITGKDPVFIQSFSARKKELKPLLSQLEKLNKKLAERSNKNNLSTLLALLKNYKKTIISDSKQIESEKNTAQKNINQIKEKIEYHKETLNKKESTIAEETHSKVLQSIFRAIKENEEKLINILLNNYDSEQRAKAFNKLFQTTISQGFDQASKSLKGAEYSPLYDAVSKTIYHKGIQIPLPTDISFEVDRKHYFNSLLLNRLMIAGSLISIIVMPFSLKLGIYGISFAIGGTWGYKQFKNAKISLIKRRMAKKQIEQTTQILKEQQSQPTKNQNSNEIASAASIFKKRLQAKIIRKELELKYHLDLLEIDLKQESRVDLEKKSRLIIASIKAAKQLKRKRIINHKSCTNKTGKFIIQISIFCIVLIGSASIYKYKDSSIIKSHQNNLTMQTNKLFSHEKENIPLKKPLIKFETSELIDKLREENIRTSQIVSVRKYLIEQELFWSECTNSTPGFTHKLTNLITSGSKKNVYAACLDTANTYYHCLNRQLVSDAAECLSLALPSRTQ